MIFPFLIHLLSCLCWLFQRHFKKTGPSLVSVGDRETVRSPKLRSRIYFRWSDESAVDLKTFAAANANHLVRDARILAAVPSFLVNCSLPLAGNLLVSESVVPKSNWQRPIQTAFLTPSLS